MESHLLFNAAVRNGHVCRPRLLTWDAGKSYRPAARKSAILQLHSNLLTWSQSLLGIGAVRHPETIMEIADLITPKSVILGLRATSKKQALQILSHRAASLVGLHERAIFDVLLEREKLGTTGVGAGVAIPHGRLGGLDTLIGVFAVLEKPINFEAIDERSVDLIFMLLAPEAAGADHLKALARISRLLRDETICEKLRGSDTVEAIYALLVGVDEASG